MRVGVEAALLGLPRGFLGVVSSRPSALCRLGVVWKMLGVWIYKSNIITRFSLNLKSGFVSLLTCLSPEGLLSFFTERLPRTLKFALPWDDFKTAKLRKNKNKVRE